jgi:hypothetical protein
MKLTLYLEFYGKDDDDLKKKQTIYVTLPNKDAYHLYEAWMHLSDCKMVDYRLIDGTIDQFYYILEEAVEETLGLSSQDRDNGKYVIEDPVAEDMENVNAIVSLYLDKRYHE